MSSFSSSLSTHTSAIVPVRRLLVLRRAGSRLASPSCSWRRRNALLLFLRHQSRSTLPLVLPCSTQPPPSLHPPVHTASTARPLAELSAQKDSPERLASPEMATPVVHAATSRHGHRAHLRRGRPTPAALAPFSLLFCAYLCAVMLTSKPVDRLIHRTRRSAACRHVRRYRSPMHVSSPSPAISGNNSSTHGCAQVLACSSTSPSPPASIIRPEISSFSGVLCSSNRDQGPRLRIRE